MPLRTVARNSAAEPAAASAAGGGSAARGAGVGNGDFGFEVFGEGVDVLDEGAGNRKVPKYFREPEPRGLSGRGHPIPKERFHSFMDPIANAAECIQTLLFAALDSR